MIEFLIGIYFDSIFSKCNKINTGLVIKRLDINCIDSILSPISQCIIFILQRRLDWMNSLARSRDEGIWKLLPEDFQTINFTLPNVEKVNE